MVARLAQSQRAKDMCLQGFKSEHAFYTKKFMPDVQATLSHLEARRK
jgi:hypothetical protein